MLNKNSEERYEIQRLITHNKSKHSDVIKMYIYDYLLVANNIVFSNQDDKKYNLHALAERIVTQLLANLTNKKYFYKIQFCDDFISFRICHDDITSIYDEDYCIVCDVKLNIHSDSLRFNF